MVEEGVMNEFRLTDLVYFIALVVCLNIIGWGIHRHLDRIELLNQDAARKTQAATERQEPRE